MGKWMCAALLAATSLLFPGCCDDDGCACCGSPSACASALKAGLAPLEAGGVWTLTADSLKQLAAGGELPGRPVTIEFTDGGAKFHGCAGVNRFFGGVTADATGGTVKFGPSGVTMMAGPGMGCERAFIAALDSADSFEIKNGKLRLLAGGSVVAEFESGKGE